MAVLRLLTGPTTREPARIPASSIALDLNQPWREPLTKPRLTRDVVGSVIFHAIVIALWVGTPEAPFQSRSRPSVAVLSRPTPLYFPKNFELTQRDPNDGKVTHTLDVRSMVSSPMPRAPRLKAPSPPPGPVAKAPEPVKLAAIEPPKIEPPKIELPKEEQPAITAVAPKPQPPAATPPPPAPPEKPKLTFEDIGAPKASPNSSRPVPTPRQLIDQTRQPATGGGGTIVGDIGDSAINTPKSQNAPSQGEVRSNLQLLSDPKGVDFKPYMIQVLTAVRRNWLAILPESARLGKRGRVIVQFAIDRSGGVPKVVIAEGAGTDAFDRAAVAAISASVPLPPLPKDYTGDRISLQFAFSYNMPAR